MDLRRCKSIDGWDTQHKYEYKKLVYFKTKQLRHPLSGLCLEVSDKKLIMNDCDANNPNQMWSWKLNDRQKKAILNDSKN